MSLSYNSFSSSRCVSQGPSHMSPFNAHETYGTIICEGTTVVPTLDAEVKMGFFFSGDLVWTCYRRNYFAVNVSYGLSPWVSNSRLYLDQGNGKQPEQIQSMAVSLAAAVDGSAERTIELIQHTPKRDKGPQLSMKKELLAPTPPGKSHEHGGYGLNNFRQSSSVPGPQLPLQNEGDSSQQYSLTSHGSSSYQHGFERIQFKSATANNGRRRAQQQYHQLIVELWANIQTLQDNEPKWIKIAARSSHPVVVRGRSPNYYQNEGSRDGGSGLGGLVRHGLGSNGAQALWPHGDGLWNGTAPLGGNFYRGTTYSLYSSPVGNHSMSSASPLSGGLYDGFIQNQHRVNTNDTKTNDAPQGYLYHPATPLYKTIPTQIEHSLPLPQRIIREEHPAAPPADWQHGGYRPSQSMGTSRGYELPVHRAIGY